jgi:serine protease Do
MIRVLAVIAALSLAACNKQDWPHFSKVNYERVSAADRPSTVQPISTPPQSYADVVDRVSPAVVTIRSAKRVRDAQQFPFLDDPFFRQFFGNPRQKSPKSDNYQMQHALGSGVIVKADGLIVTNHHVVDGADQITVELPSRQTFSAKLIGSDAPSDLAVLKIDSSSLPTLPLGDSNRVRVGDICLAVGNPLGIGETVTSGIISAKGRATGLSDGSFEDFLQTDAAINQGNSGGALVNTSGELIGINSQILSPSGGNIGIGFAIPSNMAKTVMSQLVSGGKVRRGKLGVAIQPITTDLAASMGIKELRGVLISGVTPGGPADRAGIKTGDIVTAIEGQPTNDPNELRNRIASSAPGTPVTLTINRNGKEMQVKATLDELTPQEAQTKQSGSDQGGGAEGGGALGVSVQPVTPDDAAQLGLPRGTRGLVVQSVDPAGSAAESGIQTGDVIVEVNRQPVASADDLRGALRKSSSRPALLLINRAGQTHFVTVRPR